MHSAITQQSTGSARASCRHDGRGADRPGLARGAAVPSKAAAGGCGGGAIGAVAGRGKSASSGPTKSSGRSPSVMNGSAKPPNV